MKENQEGFFAKMKNAERSGFEITMFVISAVLALAVLISVIWLAVFWNKANSSKITDEEADASSVTESAVAMETDDPDDPDEPAATPFGGAIITDDPAAEDEDEAIDEDLAKSKYGYTTAVVNMRSAASLTASVVTKVPLHTRVKLIKLHKKEWMEVTYNGTNGFINAMYLSATKPETIVAPTAPPAKTAAPTKTPKPTKKPAKTPKPTKKPKKTPKPTKEPTPTPAPTEKPTPVPTEKATEPPAETETPAPAE